MPPIAYYANILQKNGERSIKWILPDERDGILQRNDWFVATFIAAREVDWLRALAWIVKYHDEIGGMVNVITDSELAKSLRFSPHLTMTPINIVEAAGVLSEEGAG